MPPWVIACSTWVRSSRKVSPFLAAGTVGDDAMLFHRHFGNFHSIAGGKALAGFAGAGA